MVFWELLKVGRKSKNVIDFQTLNVNPNHKVHMHKQKTRYKPYEMPYQTKVHEIVYKPLDPTANTGSTTTYTGYTTTNIATDTSNTDQSTTIGNTNQTKKMIGLSIT